MRSMGLEPRVTAHVVALDPGHPYLRLPLQFATSMRARLEALASPSHLSALLELRPSSQERERGEQPSRSFSPGLWNLRRDRGAPVAQQVVRSYNRTRSSGAAPAARRTGASWLQAMQGTGLFGRCSLAV
jgi:hypothetical protein